MFLAIDIGNTNINFGLFRGRRLIERALVATKQKDATRRLKKIIIRHKADDVIICSVVPKVCAVFEQYLTRLLKKPPLILGKNAWVPIRNLYCKPEQVGQDRLVNAYAGIILYGAPLVIVDFGTALTFDIVSKKGEYSGGMILPGMDISLQVLFQKTALLPKIKLERPRRFIGRDTKGSMLSGVVYGFAALTDCLVERIKKGIGKKTKVIGTGGNIDLAKKYCNNLDRVNKDLTLLGLKDIYLKG